MVVLMAIGGVGVDGGGGEVAVIVANEVIVVMILLWMLQRWS